MSLWRDLRERNVARLVELWGELRERRLFRITAGYLAGGWLVLQGADMLAGRDLVSELAYRLVLVVYLAGIPGSLIVGWFHGEKGAQRLTLKEIGLLTVVGAGAVAGAGLVVQNHETAPETLAARADLDLRRVAVLPFDNLSGREDLGPVVDGLTGAITGRLRQVNQLEVVSESRVRALWDSTVSLDSIASRLRVGTVVSGAITGSENELRVTTRLFDGSSGALVERRAVRVSPGELLSARDSISILLSQDLREWIGQELTYQTQRASTEDATAWILLQRGEGLLRQARAVARHRNGDSARVLFRQADSTLAVAEAADTTWVDPIVARARVAYREARLLASVVGDRDAAMEAVEEGARHSRRALARSTGHASALEMLGTIQYWRSLVFPPHDQRQQVALMEAARDDLEAAVDADPTLASAYATLSHLHYQPQTLDLINTAISARRAYEADAYVENARGVLWRLVQSTLDLGQFSESRRWCQEGRDRFPDDYRFRLCRLYLLPTPATEPNVAEAWRQARAVDSLAPPAEMPLRSIEAEMYAGAVLAAVGFADSARAVLERSRSRVTHEVDREGYLLGVEAYARVVLGDEDRAVELLSRYLAGHPGHDFSVAGEISWRWRPLQDHPGFRRLRGQT